MTSRNDKRRIAQPARIGVTLIELLVVVGLIGFLAGMTVFALRGAQDDARAARTRGTITKLNDVILQQWEEYRYRAVDMRTYMENSPGVPVQLPIVARDQARLRMVILRDSMRMEMPDRITDLLYLPTQYNAICASTGVKVERAIPGRFVILRVALANAIKHLQAQEVQSPFSFTNPMQKRWQYFSLVDIDDHISSLSNSAASPYTSGRSLKPYAPVLGLFQDPSSLPQDWEGSVAEWNRSVNPSELLYLLVSTLNFGGASALEHFRPSEIGDPDGDGLLEFIDAWQNPIHWIRWPAGFNSDLIAYADSDAMDPLKTDWRQRPGVGSEYHTKTLVPLILSSGPDQEFGVIFDFPPSITSYANMTWADSPSPPFGTDVPAGSGAHSLHRGQNVLPYYYPDPFFVNGNGPPNGINQIGSVIGDAAADNVTNHDIILGL